MELGLQARQRMRYPWISDMWALIFWCCELSHQASLSQGLQWWEDNSYLNISKAGDLVTNSTALSGVSTFP